MIDHPDNFSAHQSPYIVITILLLYSLCCTLHLCGCFYIWQFLHLNPFLFHLFPHLSSHLATVRLFSVSMSLFLFCLLIYLFFRSYIYVKSYGICLFCLTYFTQHNTLWVHPCCCKWEDSLLFPTDQRPTVRTRQLSPTRRLSMDTRRLPSWPL